MRDETSKVVRCHDISLVYVTSVVSGPLCECFRGSCRGRGNVYV